MTEKVKSRDESIAEFDKVMETAVGYIDKSIHQAARNLFDKARAEGIKTGENERQQAYSKGRDVGVLIGMKTGRQSALAEIEKLKGEHKKEIQKALFDLKQRDNAMLFESIENIKKQLAEKDKELLDQKVKITHLESTLQFERSQFREAVGKLKERIEDIIADIDNCMSPDGCIICEPLSDFKKGKIEALEKIKSELFKYFPSCAEQPVCKNCGKVLILNDSGYWWHKEYYDNPKKPIKCKDPEPKTE